MSELKVNTISNAAGTNAISIDSSGNVTLAQNLESTTMSGDLTLGSNGIYLGGTGSANYLDDYEEGTWTPVFSGGSASISYSEQIGKYIKVGSLVFIQLTIFTSNVSITTDGYLYISGLPFAAVSTGDQETAALSLGRMRRWTAAYTTNTVSVAIPNTSSSIHLYRSSTSDINETYVQLSALKTGSYSYGNAIDITGTYRTAA